MPLIIAYILKNVQGSKINVCLYLKIRMEIPRKQSWGGKGYDHTKTCRLPTTGEISEDSGRIIDHDVLSQKYKPYALLLK